MRSLLIFLLIALLNPACFSQSRSASEFIPLQQWRIAVMTGQAYSVKAFYSSQPAARISVVGKATAQVSSDSEAEFWAGLKARRLTLNVSQSSSPQPGIRQITFEAVVKPAPPARALYVVESQVWQQQGEAWRLIAVERNEPSKLEQPLSLDAKIYPAALDARREVRDAVARAAKRRTNVLVVFGADWCYDCHVLEKAFQRADIAPVLHANFEVVNVDVGQGDKNQDLMNEYQVPMKRGIPGIAVLDSSGKLIYSQQNGEFERARALGPEDLLEFLKKWKPQAR
jgi:thioredoxin 1